MKKILLFFILLPFLSLAQKDKPKLVVGIVVDQMRYDYLYRYWSKYSEQGFKRLLKDGFNFKNANYNYVPTYTAPGHACIYTGTIPAINGIVGNDWYDRNSEKTIYCVADTSMTPVGTTSKNGKMSPVNLLSTTMTDELRLASNFQSKVIGIALKDRGAILPAGRTANAAYWQDPSSDRWVTSSFYMKELPEWVKQFNEIKPGSGYIKEWNTLLPIEQYTESTADDTPYEGLFRGESKPVFPHSIPSYKGSENEIIRRTPFGNTYTKDFAIAAVKGEQMGKGSFTDFLAVSFSSTDYVGHAYGLNAIETEDTYLRLDKDLGELLKFLDDWTTGDYLLFLTADHGAVHNTEFAKAHGLEAGGLDDRAVTDSLKRYLLNMYGDTLMLSEAGATNIYLDRAYIESRKMNLEEIQSRCATFVLRFPGTLSAMTATELNRGVQRTGIYSLVQKGFHPYRSADVLVQLNPGWIDWMSKTGTTHGAAYSYDTHVPVLFFGKGIKQGSTVEPVFVTDIAPTVCSFLNIEFPSGNTGRPLPQIAGN